MANHKDWIDLPITQKIEMVGKLTHLLQNDVNSFKIFNTLIKKSELAGLFNDIKINFNEGNS
jgi:hypothetical protein